MVLKDGRVERSGTYDELVADGFDLQSLIGTDDGTDGNDDIEGENVRTRRKSASDSNNEDSEPADSGRRGSAQLKVSGERRAIEMCALCKFSFFCQWEPFCLSLSQYCEYCICTCLWWESMDFYTLATHLVPPLDCPLSTPRIWLG